MPVHAYLGSSPTLDGNVVASEWADATHFANDVSTFFSRFAPIAPPPVGSPVDLDVDAWVKHDGVRLYFAVVVRDDIIYRAQTPAWTPHANPSANNLTQRGWPWFGDEVEFLLKVGSANASDHPAGVPGSWQLVINAEKSRLGGLGVGGLLEGEPRTSITAWDNYQDWIYGRDTEAAVNVHVGGGANGGSSWSLEVAFAFNPLIPVGPNSWWNTSQPALSTLFNFALGDVDAQATEGPYGLRHEEWFSSPPPSGNLDPTQFGSFAQLIIEPSAAPRP